MFTLHYKNVKTVSFNGKINKITRISYIVCRIRVNYISKHKIVFIIRVFSCIKETDLLYVNTHKKYTSLKQINNY